MDSELMEMMGKVERSIIKGKTVEVEWANRIMIGSQIVYFDRDDQEKRTVLGDLYHDRENNGLTLYNLSPRNYSHTYNVSRIMSLSMNEERAKSKLRTLISNAFFES